MIVIVDPGRGRSSVQTCRQSQRAPAAIGSARIPNAHTAQSRDTDRHTGCTEHPKHAEAYTRTPPPKGQGPNNWGMLRAKHSGGGGAGINSIRETHDNSEADARLCNGRSRPASALGLEWRGGRGYRSHYGHLIGRLAGTAAAIPCAGAARGFGHPNRARAARSDRLRGRPMSAILRTGWPSKERPEQCSSVRACDSKDLMEATSVDCRPRFGTPSWAELSTRPLQSVTARLAPFFLRRSVTVASPLPSPWPYPFSWQSWLVAATAN
jgi:hypothetical protein